MTQSRTYPSLRARIIETQTRRSFAVDRSSVRPTHAASYRERYQGTEFATPVRPVVTSGPLMTRGRTFVLVTGTAAVCLIGLVVLARPG